MNPTEPPEVMFSNQHINEIEGLDNYAKKHRNITNKILDALGIVIEQFGMLYDLQQTLVSMIPPEYQEDQTYSVNFMCFVQGIMQLMREELVKGYAKQTEYIIGDLTVVKDTLQKNLKKPVDSVETMTTMVHQVKRLFNIRNRLIQRHQYISFHYMNESLTSFLIDSSYLYKAINQLDELENESENIFMRSISYVDKSLKEILQAENRKETKLPRKIEEIIAIIHTQHIEREGIFRTAANLKQVDEIYHRMSVTDMTQLSCETLAALLKRFVRDIPDKMFDETSGTVLLLTYRKSPLREERIKNLSTLFNNDQWMSPEKLILFKSLMRLCHRISKSSEINKMTATNLSVCWTPTIFPASTEELPLFLEMVSFIIKESPNIWGEGTKKAFAIGRNVKRNLAVVETKQEDLDQEEGVDSYNQFDDGNEENKLKPSKQTRTRSSTDWGMSHPQQQQHSGFVVGTISHSPKESKFMMGNRNKKDLSLKDSSNLQSEIPSSGSSLQYESSPSNASEDDTQIENKGRLSGPVSRLSDSNSSSLKVPPKLPKRGAGGNVLAPPSIAPPKPGKRPPVIPPRPGTKVVKKTSKKLVKKAIVKPVKKVVEIETNYDQQISQDNYYDQSPIEQYYDQQISQDSYYNHSTQENYYDGQDHYYDQQGYYDQQTQEKYDEEY